MNIFYEMAQTSGWFEEHFLPNNSSLLVEQFPIQNLSQVFLHNEPSGTTVERMEAHIFPEKLCSAKQRKTLTSIPSTRIWPWILLDVSAQNQRDVKLESSKTDHKDSLVQSRQTCVHAYI